MGSDDRLSVFIAEAPKILMVSLNQKLTSNKKLNFVFEEKIELGEYLLDNNIHKNRSKVPKKSSY